MKINKRVSNNDILNWANEAKLDLPDQWEIIQQSLPLQKKVDISNNYKRKLIKQSIFSKRKVLFTYVTLAVLIIMGGLFISGRLEQLIWPSNNSNNQYIQATKNIETINGESNPTSSVSTYSDAQLAFSDKANAQFALMEQAHIPDQYEYYAGCFIEDLNILVINVTCDPEEFKIKYDHLLDFTIIEVRQVKYTIKELEIVFKPLQQAIFGLDPIELNKLGIVGLAIYEQNNSILIVVKEVNNKVRKVISEIVNDTGMIVFEVDGEIIKY